MTSTSSYHPVILPGSPRAARQNQYLTRLDTLVSARNESRTPPPYIDASGKPSPQSFVDIKDRNRDSLIFANATIPLSPVSTTDSLQKPNPYDGLAPRKRSGFARFFSCLGREERARRKVIWDTEFVKVGGDSHWTEH